MPMNTTYLNLIAATGRTAITHLGLVDETDTEITGGTYARQAVTWTAVSNGDFSPTADLPFSIPASVTVGGWHGFSALTAGTDYGGAALTQQPFVTAGTYTLLAASTAINESSS